jgi:hypothetical protein
LDFSFLLLWYKYPQNPQVSRNFSFYSILKMQFSKLLSVSVMALSVQAANSSNGSSSKSSGADAVGSNMKVAGAAAVVAGAVAVLF